ncbi:MAG: AtpZ/AtpI family protein [Chitinophagaceae bacterium]
MNYNPKSSNKNGDLLRYAGLGTQLFAALGLSVFVGLKADAWLGTRFPLLVWLLPFVVIVAVIYKLIKQTSKKLPPDAKK